MFGEQVCGESEREGRDVIETMNGGGGLQMVNFRLVMIIF
jgi:hypothetical protein